MDWSFVALVRSRRSPPFPAQRGRDMVWNQAMKVAAQARHLFDQRRAKMRVLRSGHQKQRFDLWA